ncbi:hypothetical protein U0070_012195, partial [Myodes glareolus]
WRSNDGENTTLTQGNQTENHQFSILHIHNAMNLFENGLSEDLNETVKINHMRGDTTGDDTDELQRPQAAISPGPGSELEESCELEVQLSDRDAGLEPHIPLPCSNENLTRDDSEDENSCSEESTSVTCQSSKEVQRARQAVGICSQATVL